MGRIPGLLTSAPASPNPVPLRNAVATGRRLAILLLMQLTVPDEFVAPTGCSSAELLFDLAVGLVLDGRLTLGQAAGLANLSHSAFLDELGRRRIPLPYDERELVADRQTLRDLRPGAPSRGT